MEVWTRNTCSFYIVQIKFIFVSADAEAGHRHLFPRHQILARPVGPTSPLIFEFQHVYIIWL
jgi:hypothetical protein